MRLFVATTFEDDVIERLTDIQTVLKKAGVEGRFTQPENLHMTLTFIGDYGNPDEVLDELAEVPFRPVRLETEGLWLNRDMYLLKFKQNPGMDAYVRRLRRALTEAVIPFDRKKFVPHITLARKVSFKKDSADIPSHIDYPVITVDSISLMRSDRGSSGMIYTELGYYRYETI